MLVAAATIALGSAAVPAQEEEPGAARAADLARGGSVPAGWSEAPGYVDLFAPALHRDAYDAYVSPNPLAEALALLSAEPSLLHPPGAWETQRVGALEAFGRSGRYSRGRLARLYIGTAAAMAVGPRAENGGIVETWTLISPYPDLQLTRLEPGTLLVIARVLP